MEPISQATAFAKIALLGFSLLTGGPPMLVAQASAYIATDAEIGAPVEVAQAAQPTDPLAPAPLAPQPPASAAPAAPDTTAKKLKGLAAWSALVGNTIAGKSEDDDVFEFYAKNGTAKQLLGDEKTSGKWALRGETVCLDYGDGENCYEVTVSGNKASLTDEDDNETVYEILTGNAKKL